MVVDVYRTNQTGSPVVGTARVSQSVSTEGVRATYCYASQANTPAATPTDILTITGSATKTIRITRIAIGGIAIRDDNDGGARCRRSAAQCEIDRSLDIG
jgi:hypothetical protein